VSRQVATTPVEELVSLAASAATGAGYRICQRCVMDTSAERIHFDEKGECSFCRLHDVLECQYPTGPEGERRLEALIGRIRRRGRGRRYDCILGVSGGRDSTYMLYLAVKRWGLRPLAVHFNDGFDNPVAGENIKRAVDQLGVDLRTITSDWRESKDIRIAFLRSSTPNLETGTDLGIFAALYGAAAREGLRYVLTAHSFRTEGIAPLSWTYVDGRYLASVHRRFGTVPRRQWRPADPGFNLGLRHLFYYIVMRGIRALTPMYYVDYVRKAAERLIVEELGWKNPGAHYFDDLYQSLLWHVHRVKFGIDKRRFNYSALVRSGQLGREEALERLRQVYALEDPKIVGLCVKRLGLTPAALQELIAAPPRSFRDYPNDLRILGVMKPLVRLACRMQLVPLATYDKFFRCG
jgi:N-acetyl sugar amidotransferase